MDKILMRSTGAYITYNGFYDFFIILKLFKRKIFKNL